MLVRATCLAIACLPLALPATGQAVRSPATVIPAEPSRSPERIWQAQGRSAVWATLDAISGRWSSAEGNCDAPSDTWRFGGSSVSIGTQVYDLRGLGGGEGALRMDMMDRGSGQSLAISVQRAGEGRLDVSGAGISASLVRCDELALAPRPDALSDYAGPITENSLDGDSDMPTSAEIAEALGRDPAEGPGTDDEAQEADAANRYAQLAGTWSGDGSCDGNWEIANDQMIVGGTAYMVTNVVGDGSGIGVNTLRRIDGAPATFTLNEGEGGTTISGSVSDEAGGTVPEAGATLTRC